VGALGGESDGGSDDMMKVWVRRGGCRLGFCCF